MKSYTDIIKTTLFTFAVGGLLILWGYKNDGIIRIIVGVLIIGLFTKNAIGKFKYIQELKLWQTQNNGTLIFFYPSKRQLQVEIGKKILPLLPKATLKVYYDGPSLVGDIKRSVIVELLNQYKQIKINPPCIFKIVDNKIYLETLPELNDINAINFDPASVKAKIDRVAYA